MMPDPEKLIWYAESIELIGCTAPCIPVTPLMGLIKWLEHSIKELDKKVEDIKMLYQPPCGRREPVLSLRFAVKCD